VEAGLRPGSDEFYSDPLAATPAKAGVIGDPVYRHIQGEQFRHRHVSGYFEFSAVEVLIPDYAGNFRLAWAGYYRGTLEDAWSMLARCFGSHSYPAAARADVCAVASFGSSVSGSWCARSSQALNDGQLWRGELVPKLPALKAAGAGRSGRGPVRFCNEAFLQFACLLQCGQAHCFRTSSSPENQEGIQILFLR
jgi:hypothetical protein